MSEFGEGKLFIVHWHYVTHYGEGYTESDVVHDRKELFESDNIDDFICHLDQILRERKLKNDAVKSIEMITETQLIDFEKRKFGWETCPKCGGISIEWRAERGCFRCLDRTCHHEWKEWPGGPKIYEEVRNKYLKGSLPRGEPIPYA